MTSIFSRAHILAWLLAAAFFLIPRSSQAIDDPSVDYFTIETPHFYVHYYEGMEAFARKVATACEEAHVLLVPILDWEPAGRTHVVINDRVDTANGSAGVYARRRITIFAMPPEANSVLGFYDDWLRILVYHEYVHILHLDTIGGISPYINAIIGQQLIPNQTLPRWYIEGLATYHESERTRGGRVDSSMFKMWMRVAALDGKLFELGTATGLPASWPLGSTPYIYGGFFLDYLAREYGEEFSTKFNHVYGGRLIPWSLNQIALDNTGKSFLELWDEFLAEEQGKAQATRIAVRAAGETSVEFVTKKGGQSGFPRSRPGTSEISFFLSDMVSERAFATTRQTSTSYRRIVSVDGLEGAASWTPDGRELVFSQTRTIDNLYRYNDLHVFDTRTEEIRRITEGERAREPAVSPDGKKVAYVRNRAGTMELVVLDFQHPSGEGEVLVSGLSEASDDDARWQQISMPRWSPDGKRLVFSWWTLDRGSRDLWLYDFEAPEEKRLRPLTDDFALDMDPSFGPDGLLYFASDRTGIFNIYAMDVDEGETWQISNVVNGVFSPEISPDGKWVYVAAYSPDGFDLGRFPRPTRLWRPTEQSRIDDRLPRHEYPEIDTSAWETSDYNPWPFMAPLILQPEFGVLTTGTGLAASITGQDPLERHNYAVSAGFTTGREFEDYSTNLGFTYSYRGLPVNLSLNGRTREFPRTRSFFAESRFVPFIEREHIARAGMTYPISGIDDFFSIGLSYEVDFTEFSTEPDTDPEPGDAEPIFPEQGWFNELSVSLLYSNLDQYGLSVSVEDGFSIGVRLGIQDPALGSDFETISLSYHFDTFYPNPFLERHVLALKLRGGILLSDRRTPRVFFIGGNRPQDILTSVVFQEPSAPLVVRGFPPNFTTGSQYQVGQFAYRFPILDLEDGFGTVPVYFRRLSGQVYTDGGAAFDGFAADADFLWSVGGEVQLETTFAYYLSGNLRLGVARGLTEGGITEFYLLYGGGF